MSFDSMKRILSSVFVILLIAASIGLLHACKTGANAQLISSSTFSFNGQNYSGLTVLASGTKPFIISASPLASTNTALTLTFATGNPANGNYGVAPTSTGNCVINFTSNATGTLQSYVSVAGTVSVAATSDGHRSATFNNVNLLSSTNPLDSKAISGTVIF